MSHNFKYANVNSVGTVGVGGTAVLQGNASKIENQRLLKVFGYVMTSIIKHIIKYSIYINPKPLI
jgi:hypothetical protein